MLGAELALGKSLCAELILGAELVLGESLGAELALGELPGGLKIRSPPTPAKQKM